MQNSLFLQDAQNERGEAEAAILDATRTRQVAWRAIEEKEQNRIRKAEKALVHAKLVEAAARQRELAEGVASRQLEPAEAVAANGRSAVRCRALISVGPDASLQIDVVLEISAASDERGEASAPAPAPAPAQAPAQAPTAGAANAEADLLPVIVRSVDSYSDAEVLSAQGIQAAVRGRQVRGHFVQMHKSAAKLQALQRGRRRRVERVEAVAQEARRNSAATLIQTRVRGYQSRSLVKRRRARYFAGAERVQVVAVVGVSRGCRRRRSK